MIRRAFWRYELVSRHAARSRRYGALLRFALEDGSVGFADCHPWPELGDAPLEIQLSSWTPGEFTPLMDQCMLLAILDSDARNEGRSLFAGISIPPSHLSLPYAAWMEAEELMRELEGAKAAGFDRVKVKAGDRPVHDADWLAATGIACRELGTRIRLDLNGKLGLAEAAELLGKVRAHTEELSWIDWVEDPCPFDLGGWASLREEFGLRLAYDRGGDPTARDLAEATDVLIYKSAIHRVISYSSLARWSKLPACYTSYLDHPVGQAFAAYSAAANVIDAAKVEQGGLLTHDVYEPNAFSERLSTEGPILIPPEGTGIGFDDLLESLPWEELD